MSLSTCVDRLIETPRQSSDDPKALAGQLITHVLLDSRSPAYRLPIDLPAATECGVQVIDMPLVRNGLVQLDPDRVLEVLMSMV